MGCRWCGMPLVPNSGGITQFWSPGGTQGEEHMSTEYCMRALTECISMWQSTAMNERASKENALTKLNDIDNRHRGELHTVTTNLAKVQKELEAIKNERDVLKIKYETSANNLKIVNQAIVDSKKILDQPAPPNDQQIEIMKDIIFKAHKATL